MSTHSNPPTMEATIENKSAWHAAIKPGNDQLDRGEGIVYTPKALIDITQNAIATMHGDQPMDPDVLQTA